LFRTIFVTIIFNHEVDYNYLRDKGFSPISVNSILLSLGAKETINDLSPKQLYDLLTKVQDNKVKGIQTIYKMVADALDSQNALPCIPDKLELYALKNNELELLAPNEIY
jgi:hypothetical protein